MFAADEAVSQEVGTRPVRKPLTEEQKARARAARRRWYENRTPEQIEAQRAANRRYMARNRVPHTLLTEEQKAANRARCKSYYQENREQELKRRKTNRERQIARAGIEAMREVWRAQWKARNPSSRKPSGSKAKKPAHVMGSEMYRLLRQDQLYAAAVAVVPGAIPRDVRDDIVSIICLAVLEGEIWLEDIPAYAKELINRHYRQFSKFTTVSLDMPLWHDSEKTLLDTLTTENAVLL